MEKLSNDLIENKENIETYDEYYETIRVVRVEKSYIERDNSKKNRTKNMNRARKAKAIRQGR